MSTTKAPTIGAIKTDIRWTKEYLNQILEAKRNGDYATAAGLANEISAIWATISGDFEDAENAR